MSPIANGDQGLQLHLTGLQMVLYTSVCRPVKRTRARPWPGHTMPEHMMTIEQRVRTRVLIEEVMQDNEDGDEKQYVRMLRHSLYRPTACT